MTQEKSLWKDAITEIIVGSISGATGKLVEFPFDTVKVRLQYSQSFHPPLFKSTFDCIRQTYRKEGLYGGFYKGLLPPLFGASLEASSLFFSYKLAQDCLNLYCGNPITNQLGLSEKVFCGGISGIFTSFVLTPVELVKVKSQVSNLQNRGHITTLQVIKLIYKENGLKGLWKGQIPTMIREAGGSAAWFGSYEFTLDTFKRLGTLKLENPGDEYSYKAHELLIAGAMAGVSYNISLFPVDTVKNIIQSERPKQGSDGKLAPPRTFWAIGKSIYSNSGIAGFYSGVGVSLFKTIPSSAVMFYCYEKLKNVISL